MEIFFFHRINLFIALARNGIAKIKPAANHDQVWRALPKSQWTVWMMDRLRVKGQAGQLASIDRLPRKQRVLGVNGAFTVRMHSKVLEANDPSWSVK